MIKKYAPIYIPTLCRDEHFIKGLESLKKNGWAKYTDVYIALDYPAKESHWEGYRKICDYLENGDFSVFANFYVKKREQNIGSLPNIDSMRDELMEKYDCWIMAEDDIEFSPDFLEYMNKCLDLYENDPDVFAINGYTYPIPYKISEGSNVVKQFATVSEWGIGYWKGKYLKAKNRIEQDYLRKSFSYAAKSGILDRMVNSRRCDYINYALSGNNDPLYTHMTDISMGIYINLNEMCVISPTLSKTRNHGFDGSGLYCGKIENATGKHSMDFDYTSQEIDMNESIDIIPDVENAYDENKKRVGNFLYESPGRIRKVRVMYHVFRLIGQKSCAGIYSTLKKIKVRLFGEPDRTSYYSNEISLDGEVKKMERHISFCCDDNYLIPACIMLESLMRHNKGVRFIAHTFTDDLSEKSIKKFENLLREGGCELVLHKLPENSRELIANAPTLAHISIATYYRLFLPYVVDQSIKTILYLDCDIMIRKSVKALYRKKNTDTLIIGAPDINEEDHADRIGVDKYVNTGVLTMDLPGIRQMYSVTSLLNEISNIMDQPENIVMGDQDIINLLFKGHIEEVPTYYNFQRLIHKAYCLKNPAMMKKIAIAHFITGDKPWNNDYLIVFAREYYSYLRKYLTPKQRVAWWLGKPKGVVNMYRRHKVWVDLQKAEA